MVLHILTSTIKDGSMKSVHEGDISMSNRARKAFLKRNGIRPEDTTLVRLIYEGDNYTRYSVVDSSFKGNGIVRPSTITSDALVTMQPSHALFLPIADCIGAVIHEPERGILMLSHLGRHNLEQLGGSKSVEFLVANLGVDAGKLKVWLSPAAGQASYPLYSFNHRSLHEVTIEQLVGAGVPRTNIEASPIDSAEDTNYYSHSQFLKGNRQDDGRFAVAAYMS